MYNNIVFIDFDGTITTEDTLVGTLTRLVPREFEELKEQMLSRKLTLSEGIKKLFGMVPSARYPDIEEYSGKVRIRLGFGELLDYLEEIKVPVVVISGGMNRMIDSCLEKYRSRLLEVYSAELDISGEYMKLVSQYDDGMELLKKTDIMKKYSYKKAVCIGDSYTDMNMASASDVVFARDALAEHMKAVGKHFYHWDSFNDVLETMKSNGIFNA